MKIAILGTRGIPARYGGFETFAEKLGVGLAELGHDVCVFCEAGESVQPSTFRGVKLRYQGAPALGPLQTILFDLKCLWAARKGYDIVYMLGYGAAPFCMIPRLWRTQVWINPDGLEWARAKWGRIARLYFRLMEWTSLRVANRIIADSEAIAAILCTRHGKLPTCSVIAYGCEVIESAPRVEPLSEWALEQMDYYLVVCRLEPENHVLEILRAFQQSDSRKKLVIVGNHLSKTQYAEQLRTDFDPRILMIGTVYDQAKLTSLRYHSFAYIHGHSVGGTNPSLLEAMGCGNLVFAHDNPFNRATMKDCGLFFANAPELTEAFDNAEQFPAQFDQFREAAKMRARAKFQWSDIISSYAQLICSPESPRN